eukprot:m.192741 g.192741  ORF g.192741 m.192741 type:complete len:962 (+) comp32481_c4_seq2:346-3231(+)
MGEPRATTFDSMCKHMEIGLRHQNAVTAMLKKRQQIESDYAKSLTKLYQNFKNAVSPHPIKSPMGSRRESESDFSMNAEGTGRSLWSEIVSDMECTVYQHEELAESIGETAEQLRLDYHEFETRKQKLQEKFQSSFKTMQDEHKFLRREKMSVAALRKEYADACRTRLKTTVKLTKPTTATTRDSNATRLIVKELALAERLQGAVAQLRNLEKSCVDLRGGYHSQVNPSMCAAIEKAEYQRLTRQSSCLARWIQSRVEITQRQIDRETKTCTNIKHYDARGEMTAAADKMSLDDFDFPATGHPHPTIRGNLEYNLCALHKKDSNDKHVPSLWKESLFVLISDSRKLYQYDGEDSLQPTHVHTLLKMEEALQPVDETYFDRQHVFQIITTTDIIYLHLDRENLGEMWGKALSICTGGGASHGDHQNNENSKREIRQIALGVIEAKGMIKTGDYHCVVFFEKYPMAKTGVKRGTDVPYWGKRWTFDHTPPSFHNITIKLFRLPRKTASLPRGTQSLGDLIGEIALDTELATCNTETWYPLKNSSESGIKLRLSLKQIIEKVKPLSIFSPLASLLTFDTSHRSHTHMITWFDTTIEPTKRRKAATLLLRSISTFSYVCTLCQHEIDNTSDPHTLFRRNSLASFTVDEFMKIAAIEQSDWLHSTLSSCVSLVCESKLSCEVDPSRVPAADPKEVASGYINLFAMCSVFFETICTQMSQLPTQIKHVFGFLQMACQQKFKTDAARQSSVVGFLFLRLICPAILGPHLFKIMTQAPDDSSLRTLQLVSKCILSLANGVSLREPYLLCMNSFLKTNNTKMTICVETAGRVNGHPQEILDLGNVDKPRVFTALHKLLEDGISKSIMAEEDEDEISKTLEVTQLIDVVASISSSSSSLASVVPIAASNMPLPRASFSERDIYNGSRSLLSPKRDGVPTPPMRRKRVVVGKRLSLSRGEVNGVEGEEDTEC